MTTVNVDQSTLVIDIVEQNVNVNTVNQSVTLDISSGGLVPISNDVSLTAGENLSALRAVTSNAGGQAVYASNDTLANAQVVGITSNAASAGTGVTIKTSGILTDANWTWTKGTVYLGTNGALTQSAPTSGAIVVHVGRALTSTTLQIDIDTIITTV
jgi:uncharacterized protein YgbK (DUF1537 family)